MTEHRQMAAELLKKAAALLQKASAQKRTKLTKQASTAMRYTVDASALRKLIAGR